MSVGLLAVAPVRCNSIFAKSSPVKDDGYEYVTVSGSMIPQRVRKGTKVITTSPVETMDAERFNDSARRFQNSLNLPGTKGH